MSFQERFLGIFFPEDGTTTIIDTKKHKDMRNFIKSSPTVCHVNFNGVSFEGKIIKTSSKCKTILLYFFVLSVRLAFKYK